MSDFPIKPLFDRVLVKKDDASQTKSGIHLPETVKGRAVLGTVVAVGDGLRTLDGGCISPTVKPGDRVYLREFTGYVINWENEQLFVFQESEIIGVVNQTQAVD